MSYPTNCNLPAAPGSGATIVLIRSTDVCPGGGEEVRRIVLRLLSSHVSATDGLMVEESLDGGVNYDALSTYTLPATTAAVPYSSYDIAMSSPLWRIRFTNSASVLTAWRGKITLYDDERGEA